MIQGSFGLPPESDISSLGIVFFEASTSGEPDETPLAGYCSQLNVVAVAAPNVSSACKSRQVVTFPAVLHGSVCCLGYGDALP